LEKRTKKILDEALALPESEREELVMLLVPSLETNPYSEDFHPDWVPELVRRVREIKSGRAELIPWEQVKAKLDRELGLPSDDD